ncbi:putative 4-hydroxybenzoate polyprenyl [Phaeomoniella chlamydospora]|uniref:Putative 4-hydroxybenzoate polyprenyl n=1 Tax=Phaeomoniella chlamydospora TaxID=158046 RepID=A0A0G2GNK8_PHACM|nr:putative 4-hydroxybenzoate polyprenyl [Phaeomoniella chlamydospora]
MSSSFRIGFDSNPKTKGGLFVDVAPRKGILAYLPESWVPYAELIRLEKPIGFAIVYLPYVMGILYGACIAPEPLPVSALLYRARVFLLWSLVLRGAGCAYDDIVDQDLDRQVDRCRTRPIPRGAITTTQGWLFTTGLSLVGFFSLSLLPWECTIDAGIITLLSLIYPFMKRFTNYTQVVLGLAIGFAIIMAAHSFDVDPLARSTYVPTLCLWFAVGFLMMLYDIIYARQDTKDDVKAGVKSMAVRYRHHVKAVTSLLAFAVAGLLATTGIYTGMGPMYYLIAVGGTCSSLWAMIGLMDLESPSNYPRFCAGAYVLTSISVIGGFTAEYMENS